MREWTGRRVDMCESGQVGEWTGERGQVVREWTVGELTGGIVHKQEDGHVRDLMLSQTNLT